MTEEVLFVIPRPDRAERILFLVSLWNMEKKVSLWQIFGVFAKIGAFTIGGGYAMIPLIQAEMSRRGWISDDELPDIVALSQSAPGVMAVNISIFAGHKLRGVKGSIAATLGSILPSFLIILAIAIFFTAFKDNPWVEKVKPREVRREARLAGDLGT